MKSFKSLGLLINISFLIFVFVLLVRLLVLPLSAIHGDEYCFATIAQGVIKGVIPYNYMFEHKPFGLYYFFATFMYIFGDNVFALRVIPIFVTLVSSLYIYKIFSSVDKTKAIFVSSLYSLALLGPSPEGLASDSEIIVNMFIFMGIYLLFFSRNKKSQLLSSVAFALSVSINYLALPIVFSLLGFEFFRNRDWGLKNPLLLLTYALLMLFTYLLFYIPNILDGSIINIFEMQKRFVDTYRTVGFIDRIDLGKIYHSFNLHKYLWMIPIYLLSIKFVKKIIRSFAANWCESCKEYCNFEKARNSSSALVTFFRKDNLDLHLVLLTFVSAFISFVSPGQYWPHHYFMMFIPLILLTGALISRLELSNLSIVLITALLLMNTKSIAPKFIYWGAKGWANIYKSQPIDYIDEIAIEARRNAKNSYMFLYSVKNQHQGLYFISKLTPPTIIPLWNQVTFQGIGPAFLGHSSLEEFRSIMSKKPSVVMIDPELEIENSEADFNKYLVANLKENYKSKVRRNDLDLYFLK